MYVCVYLYRQKKNHGIIHINLNSSYFWERDWVGYGFFSLLFTLLFFLKQAYLYLIIITIDRGVCSVSIARSFIFPDSSNGKESACNVGGTGDLNLIPGLGRFTGGGQPTPVFLPGKSHGQRSLVGYSP